MYFLYLSSFFSIIPSSSLPHILYLPYVPLSIPIYSIYSISIPYLYLSIPYPYLPTLSIPIYTYPYLSIPIYPIQTYPYLSIPIHTYLPYTKALEQVVGTQIKSRVVVRYVNAFGEDEAGIDVGGLFKASGLTDGVCVCVCV